MLNRVFEFRMLDMRSVEAPCVLAPTQSGYPDGKYKRRTRREREREKRRSR